MWNNLNILLYTSLQIYPTYKCWVFLAIHPIFNISPEPRVLYMEILLGQINIIYHYFNFSRLNNKPLKVKPFLIYLVNVSFPIFYFLEQFIVEYSPTNYRSSVL